MSIPLKNQQGWCSNKLVCGYGKVRAFLGLASRELLTGSDRSEGGEKVLIHERPEIVRRGVMLIFEIEVKAVLRMIEGGGRMIKGGIGSVEDFVLALDERSIEVRDVPEQAADIPCFDVEQGLQGYVVVGEQRFV